MIVVLFVVFRPDECRGCRVCRDDVTQTSFELLQSDDSSVVLRTTSADICQSWVMALCKVVGHFATVFSIRSHSELLRMKLQDSQMICSNF